MVKAGMHSRASTPAAPARMLFLIDRLDSAHAGTEGQLSRLIHALAARGTSCHLVVLAASEYLATANLPCTWSALGHSRLRSPGTWLAMYRLGRALRRRGYKLAQTFFNDVSVLAPPMLHCAGIRTVISRRDMGFWYTPGYLPVLRTTGRWVSACVANSQAVADLTVLSERIPEERVHVIYNGLAADKGSASPVPELAALKEKRRLLCGVVANVRPIKRLGDLVAAVARIAEEVPELDAVFIGAGDSSDLRAQAERCGIGSRVHFLDRRADVAGCLRYFDIGVLCSESEGFSNSVIEYMQAGLPSICSDAGGNPEAISHEQTGVLYPVGDVEALAYWLQKLARDAEWRGQVGAQAKTRAHALFSIDRMVDDYIALYQRLSAGVSGTQ